MSSENDHTIDYDLVPLFFRHNIWANLQLVDTCLGLNDDQLNFSIPGTYGSIWRTISHLVHAEEYYLSLLTGFEDENAADVETGLPISELRERLKQSGERLLEAARTVPYGRIVTEADDPEQIPASILLLQVIHHAHEHRTQIATILGQLGMEAKELSGWTYFDDEIAPYET